MKAKARMDWILKWLADHVEASAVNQDFHEDYHRAFPSYRRRETCWGAQPVAQAMRDLMRLHKSGLVVRRDVGLKGTWQPGFPKWTPCYSLPETT